uniref:trypsin n=1 Tax=Myripristis murdjan TaxID=586833 RepID=A0A667X171_9TELE
MQQQIRQPVKPPFLTCATAPPTTSPTTASPTTASPAPTRPPRKTDDYLGPAECLEKEFTRASCDLVFCPPWERCINGHCSCKLPYLCPRDGVVPVCGRNTRKYLSYCQVTRGKALTLLGNSRFSSFIDPQSGVVKLFLPSNGSSIEEGPGKEVLVCGTLWDMAAANAACKDAKHKLGAASARVVPYHSLTADPSNEPLPGSCVSVRCQGYERSLAECVIYDPTEITATAATATADNCEFKCVNKKCVSVEQTCDGVDDCGDRSDEMCCKKCRNDAFHCRTGVCVHKEAVRDGIVDCLDGKDESPVHTADRKYISPKSETRANRQHLESKLYCGIPNSTTVDDEEEEERVPGGRVKRVVGGVPAKPTQIQWQVGIEEYGKLDCGGAYIGGCWVLTAAHCVRPKPSAFQVKFSLWKKRRPQDTTDVVPVHDIHIHPKYNAATYENDIALVELEKLPFKQECLVENPAVSAVCIPWSPQLFQTNHTCSISGWGRTTAGGSSARVLLWANVSLISNCQRFYKDRFKPGMMCAGDLKGDVDSCQGDSGGPLVCEDDQGISYLWGIVSWGERCGQPGFPGVYTQVNFITRDVPCHLRPRFCPYCL